MAAAPVLDVLVIGAGFAGLAMAHALSQRSDTSFLVVEKAERIGGAWRDNVYPGCACDIPSHLYSFSFAPNPDWSHIFADQEEILAYMERVADEFDLRKHIRLNTGVQQARWDAARALWTVSMSDGTRLDTRVLVSAIGVLHHPSYPSIEGIDTFQGKLLHTARWDRDYDISGKRVAVIGTGASVIQLVPAIVEQVSQLTVFQRTPPWIVPKFNRPIDERRRRQFRRLPLLRRYYRSKLWWIHERRAAGFTRADPELIAKTEAMCRRLLERQVRDPQLRAQLTPDYALGCKRLLISSDYYPALQKPNARLITTPIQRIEPRGVVTSDEQLHEADTIVFGTGFDAQNSVRHVPIIGAGGEALGDVWERDGMSALLGTTVAGFPNLFLITGPNAGGGHNSQVFMIEAQVRYIMDALRQMRARRAAVIEVRREAQDAFTREMHSRMEHSVWEHGGCQSWYLDSRGRNTLLWPSYSADYWWRTRRIKPGHYSFESAPPAHPRTKQ